MASEPPTRTGLLIDWGGVLTGNLFSSFNAFCAAEGLEPDAIATAFRSNPEARDLSSGSRPARSRRSGSSGGCPRCSGSSLRR